MQGSPRLNKEEAEKDYKNNQLKENENGRAYWEGIFFDQEPDSINGELLKKILHRSVGALTFLNKYKQFKIGSGVLISRDVVLTAAHNIFDRSTNSENTGFKFYLGADGEAEDYYQIEAWKYPEEFKVCSLSPNLPYDYAIMKLKKSVFFDKYLPLSLVCAQCLLKDNKIISLELYGFPGAYSNCYSQSGYAFKDNLKPINPQVQQGIKTKLIAVHIGRDKAQFNAGRIVDANFVNILWKWREELNAGPFYLDDYGMCPHVKQTLIKMEYRLNFCKIGLKSVDLRQYGNLLQLNLQENQLRQINLFHCPRLTKLNLESNQLQRIDLANNKHINQLNLSFNQLKQMDVRANVHIAWLNLSYNKLKEINTKANVNLYKLQLSNNKLQQLDLRANVNLTIICVRFNKLKNIDVRANVNLTRLYLSKNQLQEIDVKVSVNLTHLQLFTNEIAEIDLTNNTKLNYLRLQENRLARVRLCISENVQEENYTDCFSLSHQQSAVCRVQLMCEGQGQAVRGKAIRIVDQWMQIYSDERFNKHRCAFCFFAF